MLKLDQIWVGAFQWVKLPFFLEQPVLKKPKKEKSWYPLVEEGRKGMLVEKLSRIFGKEEKENERVEELHQRLRNGWGRRKGTGCWS